MKSPCDNLGELLNSWDSDSSLDLCLFVCLSQFLTKKNPQHTNNHVWCALFKYLMNKWIVLRKSLAYWVY